nr:centrosomal protein of 78 kDa [Hydra vulgaris]XP_047123487.1 centrosomal protein of 78 kDa [Hydra vulgaris]
MNQTQKRQQKEDFGFEYERLCAQFSCCPSSCVTANLKDYKLDFNGDRIGLKEWEPLLCSIKVNKSLKTISIKSVKQPTEGNKLVKKKVAAIRSKEITIKLARALKDCLENSQCLECLVLQNIPFREQDVYILAKGLENSKSLKHLSFEKSKIGDTLFKVICKSIKSSQTLVSINVSGCGLTWKSAEDLASIIKYQATNRFGEAWQESLRYRKPNLDQMPGLRRISICDNNIGDCGARLFADALKDDLWLKALDLQQCGISSEGALIIQQAITFNKTLLVLDLRRNPQIDYGLLRSIIEQVMINARGEHIDYQWLSGRSCTETRQPKKSSNYSCQTKSFQNKITKKLLRDTKRTNYQSCYADTNTSVRVNKINVKNSISSTLESISDGDNEKLMREKVKQEFYKEKCRKEKYLRLIAVAKSKQLEEEKKCLENEIVQLKMQLADAKAVKTSNTFDLPVKSLDDENVLESIEASFERFQQFLDMLKELGLGDLYSQLQKPEVIK